MPLSRDLRCDRHPRRPACRAGFCHMRSPIRRPPATANGSSYAYAAAWFDGAGFHFWNDNGFQPKHWGREEFSEFLAAWSVIRRVRPRRLLRTAGFVYSREACRRQPDIVERYASRYYQDGKGPVFRCDIINTAEEGVAFAYEQARMDGQAAGFLTDWEHLDRLSARDCHTLVLPPLTELTPDERRMIQRLHAQGINLLALERVDGLESLFGVAPLTRPPILRALRVNARGCTACAGLNFGMLLRLFRMTYAVRRIAVRAHGRSLRAGHPRDGPAPS